MPFKSKAQMRWMFAAEERGELPKGTARRWAEHTPNTKSLPERASSKEKHKKKAASEQVLSPDEFMRVLAVIRKQQAINNIQWGLIGAGLGAGLGYYRGSRLAQTRPLFSLTDAESLDELLKDPQWSSALLGGSIGAGLGALTSQSLSGTLFGMLAGGLAGRYLLPRLISR